MDVVGCAVAHIWCFDKLHNFAFLQDLLLHFFVDLQPWFLVWMHHQTHGKFCKNAQESIQRKLIKPQTPMLGTLGDFAKFPVGNFRQKTNRYEEMVKHPIFSGSFEHPIWWIWQRKIPTKSLWLGSKRYMDGTEKPGSQWKCWGISSYFLSCKFVLERKAQFLKIPALLCFCFLLLGFANNLNFERLNSWGVNGFRILEIYPLTPPLSSNHHS